MASNPAGNLSPDERDERDEREQSPRRPVSVPPSITSTGIDISSINIHCINPACNGLNCVDCPTVTLHPPYLTETPDARNQELWIRRVGSAVNTHTERQTEEMRLCMETGERVLALATNFVNHQKALVDEMREINRTLDQALERISATAPDDDILHDQEVDQVIIDALTQLRNGDVNGDVNGDRTNRHSTPGG